MTNKKNKKVKANVKKSETPDNSNKKNWESVKIENIAASITPNPTDASPQPFGAPEPQGNNKQDFQQNPINQATKEFLNPQVIGSVVDSIFSLTAAKFGDHWKLKPYETENLSKSLCSYLNVVLPEILKQQPELLALGLTAIVILAPRVIESVKRNKSLKTQRNITEPSKADGRKPSTTQKGISLPGFRSDNQQSKR